MAGVGETIRVLRARVGLSQGELARLVGLSQAQVSRLERGHTGIVRPRLLVRLASVLGVSPAQLLPELAPWRGRDTAEIHPAEVFRVGFWESAWSAPLVALAADPPETVRLSSRVLDGRFHTMITPEVQSDPKARPLTPRELVRALRAGYYVAVVVPRDVIGEYQSELIECAQVALVVDGMRVAVSLGSDEEMTRIQHEEGGAVGGVSGSRAVRQRLRLLAARAPIPLYFPSDVGAARVVRGLHALLEGALEDRPIPPEQWQKYWSGAESFAPVVEGPVIAVAPEPYLDTWRHAVWETNRGLPTFAFSDREFCPDAPPAMSRLSLVFRAATCDAWIADPVVYEFLELLEQVAEQLRSHSGRLLTLVADRLRLDVSSLVAETARCDFTPHFSPSWVDRLRNATRRRET